MTIDEAINHALTLHNAGQLAEAENIYRQILAAVPDHPEALHFLGVLSHQSGNHDLAINLINRSLSIRPTAGAWSNLGEILRNLGRLDSAVAAFQKAIAMDPLLASAYSNLGAALCSLRRPAEAEHVLRRALELDPNFAAALQNLMNALGDLGQVDQAVVAGRRAVQLAPDNPSGWSDLGVASVEQGDLPSALAALDRSIRLNPSEANPHHNRAQVLLRMGDFLRGWEEYEWRWACLDFPSPKRNFPQPLWDGSPLDGRTLLLHAEQGFGDAIMFARYIPLVSPLAEGKLIIDCQPELISLLQPLAPSIPFIARNDPLPPFDLQCPFLSLPRAFKTTLDTIPSSVPYLHADSGRSAHWRDRLSKITPHFKIGLVWAGRPSHVNDRNRSVALARFSPLACVPDITFFSLQLGPAASQSSSPPPGMSLIDLSSDIKDYSDTAAIVANLDLVISVDTSIVHLAGALAKPVWTLLPFAGDWRWINTRQDSPWYPTMRLFRQKQWGAWDEVFHRVASQLHTFANSNSSSA